MTSISVQTHDPPPKTMPAAKALSSQLPLTDKSSGKVKPRSSDMKTVALLGITQRQIRVKIQANLENQKRSKVLKLNIKTAGDWLKFKWIEKNLTLSHVAVKMGIAISLIRSWESSTTRPDSKQLEGLSYVLGFNAKDFETLISNPMNLPCLALENQT